MANEDNVTMEDVRIIFRNFEGKEGQYNRAGDRNFAVLLDDDVAAGMTRDGWNIKYLKPREVEPGEDEHADAYLPVAVKYGTGKPPLVVLLGARGRTNLGEDEVEMVDWVDIAKVDLIVRPYDWNVNGNSGRKAYLKSIFITINEDELELKYADVKVANSTLDIPEE